MTRIGRTLLVAGLSWLSPACGGHSNRDVPGLGGAGPTASSGAAGTANAGGSHGQISGGSLNGGGAVMGGMAAGGMKGSGALPSTAGGSGATSSGGEPLGGLGGVPATGGDGEMGGTGGGLSPDWESSAFATNVRAQLDGFLFMAPCETLQDTRVCSVPGNEDCQPNDDLALSGTLTTDRTLHLGGNPALVYEVTLHVQGLTEASAYESGLDQRSSGEQTRADGFYTDGTPVAAIARDVFMIRVGAPAHDYFLNSIATDSDTRLRDSVFPVDYAAKIRIQGGTTVRLVASDSNCQISRNCADSEPLSECNPLSFANLEPRLVQKLALQQPYDGQFLGIVVTDITLAQ